MPAMAFSQPFLISRTTNVRALSAVAEASFLESYAHMITLDNILSHNAAKNSPTFFQSELDDGSAAWLVTAPETDTPVGFALLTTPDLPGIETQEGDLELKRIYLLHRFHGAGLGHQLFANVLEEARTRDASRLLLGVYHANPTVSWYKRQGFAEIGTRDFTVGARTYHDLILAKAL